VARGPAPLERDAFGYWRLSTLVIEGDLLMLGEQIAYRTPGYPWFLALIRAAFDRHALLAVSVIQSVLAVMSLAIAASIARRITRLPSASLWTLAVSLPAVAAWTYNAATLSESLFTFLLMLHLQAVVAFSESSSTGRAVWTGATFSIALLTRPVILLLWVPHLLLLAQLHWRDRRSTMMINSARLPAQRRLIHVALAAMVSLVMCGPWLFRNDLLFGMPFLTEFLGRNMWVVAFQGESGAGLSLPDSPASEQLQLRLNRVGEIDQWQATWGVSNALVRSGLSDPDADQLMKEVAVDAARSQPKPFLFQAFRRTINFWRCAATELPEQGAAAGNMYGQVTWNRHLPLIEWAIENRCSQSVLFNTILLFMMLAGLLVLWISPLSRPYGIWLTAVLAYFSVVTGVLEIPAYRYRMVMEPLVALVIGAAVSVLLSWRRKEAKLAR
jgi:hypothetical protein